MATTSVDGKVTLSSIGFEVLRTFNTVLDAWIEGQSDQKITYDALLHQQERFDLWAINIGLYQNAHGSLDYRLRDAPAFFLHCEKLLSNLKDLLHDLLNAISCSHPEDAEDPDDDPDSEPVDGLLNEDFEHFDHEEYDDQSIVQAMFEGIVDCTHRLYQLSMKVRAASRRLGSLRGYSYRKYDDETQLDLFDRFTELNIDEAHIKQVLISLRRGNTVVMPNDEILLVRLAKANNQRRRQFAYWSQHKINLVRRSEVAKGRQNEGQPMLAPSEASKPTTATQFMPSEVNLNEDVQSVTSVMSIDVSEVKDSGEELEIPGPPEKYLAHESLQEFECPYCFSACSARFLNIQKWKTHLLKDLRPYLCIAEHCQNALQLYDSFSDWANHDMQYHMKYSTVTERSQTLHESIATQSHIVPSLETNFKRVRDCPFCLQSTDSVGAFYKHVANHLIRIALFSLPRSTGIENDEEDLSAASDLAVNSEAELQSNSESPSAFSGAPLASMLKEVESLSADDLVDDWNTPLEIVLPQQRREDSQRDLDIANESSSEQPEKPLTSTNEGFSPVSNLYEYFIPGWGIDFQVLQDEIHNYLGHGATCRPGISPSDGSPGFLVKAYRAPTTRIIQSLRESSVRFRDKTHRLPVSSLSQSTLAPAENNDEQITTKCICTYDDKYDSMVFCEKCGTYQHIECYYHNEAVPEHHFCVGCLPRDFDQKKATERQRRVRERRDSRDSDLEVKRAKDVEYYLREQMEKHFKIDALYDNPAAAPLAETSGDSNGGDKTKDLVSDEAMSGDAFSFPSGLTGHPDLTSAVQRNVEEEEQNVLQREGKAEGEADQEQIQAIIDHEEDLSTAEKRAAAIRAARMSTDDIRVAEKRRAAEERAIEKILSKAKERSSPSSENPAPIRFKDALGRKYNFPFERCKEWKDMENLINQAFQHIEDIGVRVIKGHYDLFGDKEIILPEYWDIFIKPGMAITMTLWPLPDSISGPTDIEHDVKTGGPLLRIRRSRKSRKLEIEKI